MPFPAFKHEKHPSSYYPYFLAFPLEQSISKKLSVFTAATCHSLQTSFCSHLPPKSLLSKGNMDFSPPKSDDQLSVSIVLGLMAIFNSVGHSLAVEILSSLGSQTSPLGFFWLTSYSCPLCSFLRFLSSPKCWRAQTFAQHLSLFSP